jgi:hypothetical protein
MSPIAILTEGGLSGAQKSYMMFNGKGHRRERV